LGLSISFGIIQKHKGDIVVESILSQGTTFSIRLPYTGIDAQAERSGV
jgi:two-component system NtrC family sensor kinase